MTFAGEKWGRHMVNGEKIYKELEDKFGYKSNFQNLANNPVIESTQEAFDYDKIKERLAGQKCTSADALLVRRNLYFIEFKTGFAVQKQDINATTHKDNLRLNIRLKAYESLALFEKIILPEVEDGKLEEKTQKYYIAVIDTEKDPMMPYADILRRKSGVEEMRCKEQKRIFENSLLNYRKEVSGGQRIFYDNVEVWYDREFDARILKLK